MMDLKKHLDLIGGQTVLHLKDQIKRGSFAATGMIDSGWVNLTSTAKTDTFIAVTYLGGDGAADPAIGFMTLHFR